jgi:hypothetical protein
MQIERIAKMVMTRPDERQIANLLVQAFGPDFGAAAFIGNAIICGWLRAKTAHWLVMLRCVNAPFALVRTFSM